MVLRQVHRGPKWDQTASKWTWDQAYKNAWRTRPLLDADDLYNEGYLKWIHILDRYPTVVCQRHAMGLYMRAFKNHITDLAIRRRRFPVLFSDAPDQELNDVMESFADDGGIPVVDAKLDQAGWSKKVGMLLDEFQDSWPTRKVGETMNGFLCRVAGFDPRAVDMAALVPWAALGAAVGASGTVLEAAGRIA